MVKCCGGLSSFLGGVFGYQAGVDGFALELWGAYSISIAFTTPSCPGLLVTLASFSLPSLCTFIIAPFVLMFDLANNLLASFVFTEVISHFANLCVFGSVILAYFVAVNLTLLEEPLPDFVSRFSFVTVESVFVSAALPPIHAFFLSHLSLVPLFPPDGFLSDFSCH